MKYSSEQIQFISNCRDSGQKWAELTEKFNKKFRSDQSENALRFAYVRYTELEAAGLPEVDVTLLRQARSASKMSSRNQRRLNIALDAMTSQEDILEKIKDLLQSTNFAKLAVDRSPKKAAIAAVPMVVEVLLSDLHYGKKTDTFNSKIARTRMKAYKNAVMDQIVRHEAQGYAIESIDVALLGDIIESSTMHGAESLKSSEFGNSEQVVLAIKSLFEDFFVPLSVLGIPLIANCVAGNHERTEHTKTYVKPGKEYLSWIIYNTLDMLCTQAKIPVTFNIAEGPTLLHKIFDDYVLYEHFDLVKACTKASLSDMLSKRQTQTGKIVKFYRGGHYHEYTMFNRGQIIVNGCLSGADDYSDSFGYNTEAVQVINFYCQNTTRPNSYYYSFPVFLGGAA